MKFLQRTKPKTNFQQYFKTMAQRYLIEYIIANTFNGFFTNIGEKIANGIDYVGNRDYNYYLTKDIHSYFNFLNIDEAVVKKTINNLQAKSSSGCDGISSKLLKVIVPVIIKSLTLLINQVLDSGIFPDKFKFPKSYQLL